MRLESYKEAKNIPEKYLSSYIDAEIECWWCKPFDEYRICNNWSCWAMFSIENVYWSVWNYKQLSESEKLNTIFCCTECWTDTKLFYEKSHFTEVLLNYFKDNVSLVLLLDNELVEWFWLISQKSIYWVVNSEFSTRPWSYDNNFIQKRIISELSTTDLSVNLLSDIVCLNHVFVSSEYRNWNISFELLKQLILLWEEYNDLPVVWEARYDNKFYPISRTIWFKNLEDDKHWYIIQLINKYKYLLDFVSSNSWFFDKKILSSLIKFKKEWLWILDSKKYLSIRKKYVY